MGSIVGTDAGDDFLVGTHGADSLAGLGGNDGIFAGAGNDTVDGGAGNDFLDGGYGNDVLIDNDGNNTLVGGWGADTLDASGAIGAILSSHLYDSFENLDVLDQKDVLIGGEGDELFRAGYNDLIRGGAETTRWI